MLLLMNNGGKQRSKHKKPKDFTKYFFIDLTCIAFKCRKIRSFLKPFLTVQGTGIEYCQL
jgi:hypothetical protein